MTETFIAWSTLIVSSLMLFSARYRNPMGVLVVVITLYVFGPVFVVAFDGRAFRSFVPEYAAQAAIIEGLGIWTLLAFSLWTGSKDWLSRGKPPEQRVFPLLPPVYLASAAYFLLRSLEVNFNLAKKAIILDLGRSTHYTSLAFGSVILATFFIAGKRYRKYYFIFAAAFSLYNLLTWERDFIAAFGGVGIFLLTMYWWKNDIRGFHFAKGGIGIVLVSLAGFAFASGLFIARKIQQGVTTNQGALEVLNQSSSFAIDTWVLSSFPNAAGMYSGQTYLTSLIELIPGANTGAQSLSAWFRDLFNPGGATGYGFSLSLEGYLNFGYVGPILPYFIIGALLSWSVVRFDTSYLAMFLGPMVFSAAVYASRAESRSLFSGLFHGFVIFAVIWITSAKAGPQEGLSPRAKGRVANGRTQFRTTAGKR